MKPFEWLWTLLRAWMRRTSAASSTVISSPPTLFSPARVPSYLTSAWLKLLKSTSVVHIGDGAATQTVEDPLTAFNVIVGTPHYMAPEQIQRGTVDARSDI